MNIEQLKQTNTYKRQRHYVVYDCGKMFKNRYAVQSLHDFVKETKYFSNQKDAIDYYNQKISRFTPIMRVRGKYIKKNIRNINTGQVFESIKEAQEFYGRGGLSLCLYGKRKYYAGFKWEYVDEC